MALKKNSALLGGRVCIIGIKKLLLGDIYIQANSATSIDIL